MFIIIGKTPQMYKYNVYIYLLPNQVANSLNRVGGSEVRRRFHRGNHKVIPYLLLKSANNYHPLPTPKRITVGFISALFR